MNTRFFKEQSGSIFSIEFAVLAPVFIIFICLFIELCRLLFISSVLDLILVESSYYISKNNDNSVNYSQVFYNKVSDEIPAWPLLTSDNNLVVNIIYCSAVEDAINYVSTSTGRCTTNPMSHSVAIFSVKYNYPSAILPPQFDVLSGLLVRSTMVFKEY